MKRSASEAFAPQVPASGVFQPGASAMMDPKAYFAAFQQASLSGQALAPPGTPAAMLAPQAAAASTAPAPAEEKSEVHQQVEAASAVRCASIVKDKGANFTTVVAIEALSTMATKSSYKLREELLKQAHVKKLCERVAKVLAAPPSGLSLETLSRAAWSLVRFPAEVLGAPATTLGPAARLLGAACASGGWPADTASRLLWCLAKAEIILQHKQIVSQVVREFTRDLGRRVPELSQEGLVNMLSAIAKARQHTKTGDLGTVRLEANDELFFSYASKRIIAESETMDVRLVADVAHIHAQAGLRDEKLFKAICPRVMAKQKELDEKAMGRCIKAYARFMIPLREEAQGFRTMAVVAKGDFIRPSDKPKKDGKKKYDHPVALYAQTQLHTRA